MIRIFWLSLIVAFSISCRSGSSPWTELDSIEDLKEAFNRDTGKARIVLLLSPT